MRKSYIQKLYDNLLNDENYIKFCKIYEREKNIDLDLLKELLKTHNELYYTFLKINVFFYYKYDYLVEKINKNFDIDDNKISINDIELILNHYVTNSDRCHSCIEKLIKNKLVDKDEQMLLLSIYSKEVFF